MLRFTLHVSIRTSCLEYMTFRFISTGHYSTPINIIIIFKRYHAYDTIHVCYIHDLSLQIQKKSKLLLRSITLLKLHLTYRRHFFWTAKLPLVTYSHYITIWVILVVGQTYAFNASSRLWWVNKLSLCQNLQHGIDNSHDVFESQRICKPLLQNQLCGFVLHFTV